MSACRRATGIVIRTHEIWSGCSQRNGSGLRSSRTPFGSRPDLTLTNGTVIRPRPMEWSQAQRMGSRQIIRPGPDLHQLRIRTRTGDEKRVLQEDPICSLT